MYYYFVMSIISKHFDLIFLRTSSQNNPSELRYSTEKHIQLDFFSPLNWAYFSKSAQL